MGQGGSSGTANEVDLALMALLGPNGAYHVVNGNELPNVFADIYDQITCPPHLVAAKAVDKSVATPGDVLHYTISLSNDGGSDANGVEVHDDITALLAHGTFGSCDSGCSHDADSVDWSDLTVPVDGSLDLHFSIDLDDTGWDSGDTHLPNTVVVPSTNCKAESRDSDCSVETIVTYTPPTEPPVTEPPVTEPPVTEPPVTEPPVTEPPVTEPPVTEPPAPSFEQSEAPVTDVPTLPNTAAIGTSGPGSPSDGGWPLVFGLSVVLGVVLLVTPLPLRRRR
jgi:uncharacterized repeat protein (TIGR01451 family)